MHRSRLLKFIVTTSLGIYALSALADPKRAFLSDVMPDDCAAFVGISPDYRDNKGSNVLWVSVDGAVERKSRGMHTLGHFFGMSQTQFIEGLPGPEVASIAYVDDYRNLQAASFISLLADHPGPRQWKRRDYRKVLPQFFSPNDPAELVALGNVETFVDIQERVNPRGISTTWLGGLVKKDRSGHFSTAFNGHGNVDATIKFLDYLKTNKVPTRVVSSDLIQGIAEYSASLNGQYSALLQDDSNGKVMRLFLDAMELYRDEVANVLTRNYGLNAPFVNLWDPQTQIWMQDLIFMTIVKNPQLAKWQPADLAISSDLTPDKLGFKVSVTKDDDSHLLIATEINIAGVAESIHSSYSKAHLIPEFKPEEVLATEDSTPIALITKTAIDDIGALQVLAGAENRLSLVAAESTQSPLLTKILKRLTQALNMQAPPVVVTGAGESFQTMANISAYEKVEYPGLVSGKLYEGVLKQDEIEQALTRDPEKESAAHDLIALLETHDIVDLVNTTSFKTLAEVFRLRPDLVRKLRYVHLMGGGRAPDSEDDLGGWMGLKPSRNTEVDPQAAQFVLDVLQQHPQTSVFYSSSHLSGGVLAQKSLPQSQTVWKTFADTSFERLKRVLKLNWNDQLIESKVPINREENLGPQLAWLQAVMAVLGGKAQDYFPTIRGKLSFNQNGHLDFEPNDSGNLYVVQTPETSFYLDSLVATLSKRSLERAALADQSCIDELKWE